MPALTAKPYLIDVTMQRDRISDWGEYPFSLPVVRNLEKLSYHADVTFLIGENGSGKSTLLEAIAQLTGFNPEGGTKNSLFTTRDTHSNLHEFLKAGKSFKSPKDGFFLRAESFYNLASYMDEVDYLGAYGGKSLHAQSHGESFITVLTRKLRGGGLYLFDEPEAALSPSRQLAALAAIHRLVCADSQFIIATHSPILMAYPNAMILQLEEDGIRQVHYEETEHYQISRDFFDHREQMLRVLMEEEQ